MIDAGQLSAAHIFNLASRKLAPTRTSVYDGHILKRDRAPGNRRSVIATVKIRYFAILREQAGRSGEDWGTEATTAGALFDELSARYKFSLPADMVRVAVNQEYRSLDHTLSDGDEVVFIPPVSGG